MGITFAALRSRQVAGFKAAFTVLTPQPDEPPIDAAAYFGTLSRIRKNDFKEISDDGVNDLEGLLSRAARL